MIYEDLLFDPNLGINEIRAYYALMFTNYVCWRSKEDIPTERDLAEQVGLTFRQWNAAMASLVKHGWVTEE